MFSRYTNKHGLTLVELVLAVAIGSLITLAIYNFAGNTIRYQDEFKGRLAMLDDVRQVLRPMASELRQMQDSSVGGYAIELVASDTIVFFSDILANNYRERVRYFLEEGSLKKGVVTPTGNPLAYDLNNEVVTTLMKNVTNVTFRYYDESYSGATGQGALVHPFPAIDVRMVEIDVSIDDDANVLPNPLGQVSAFAQLRNLKDNL